LVQDLQAEKVCCNAKVVSAVSVPAQGFVRLSPQSLCSFPNHPESPAANHLNRWDFTKAQIWDVSPQRKNADLDALPLPGSH
jgi:hypothetical protein